MASITITVNDEQLHQVEIIAGLHGTSVDALIAHYLAHLVRSGIAESDAMNGNLQILFSYSVGNIGRREARDSLGVDDLTLALMLRQAGFPPPRASRDEEDRMLDEIQHIRLTGGDRPA